MIVVLIHQKSGLLQPVLSHISHTGRTVQIGSWYGHQSSVISSRIQTAASIGIINFLNIIACIILIDIGQVLHQLILHQLIQNIFRTDKQRIRQFPGSNGQGHLPVIILPIGLKVVQNPHIQLIHYIPGISIVLIGIPIRKLRVCQSPAPHGTLQNLMVAAHSPFLSHNRLLVFILFAAS